MKTILNSVKTILCLNCVAVILAGSAIVILPGCGGGGATYRVSGNTTLGQELQDLQTSYEKGIITKSEYEKTKKQLIKKYSS